MTHPNTTLLDEPYTYLNESPEYEVASIIRRPPVDNDTLSAGDFPANVAEYYWIRGGEHDEQPWCALGRLKTGVYFYFTAWCDYTGFDCRGGMNLWLSKTRESVISHGMNDSERAEYLMTC